MTVVIQLLMLVLAALGCSRVITSAQVSKERLADNDIPYYLPKGLVTVQVVGGDRLNTTVRYVPDPDHAYRVRMSPSIFAKDEIAIQLSDNGLFLKTVSATSKDEVPQIVKSLGELAAEAAKVAIRVMVDEGKTVATVMELDPTDPEELKSLKEKINTLSGGELLIDVLPLGEHATALHGAVCIKCEGSVRFRPLLPYAMVLRTRQGQTESTSLLLLPNRAPILGIDIRRAAFVEKKTVVSFADGFLTKVEVTKPSEVLGVISIPLDIAKAIVSIPSAMLQFKIDSLAKETQLLQAQKTLIETQAALIEAQRKAAERPPGKQ